MHLHSLEAALEKGISSADEREGEERAFLMDGWRRGIPCQLRAAKREAERAGKHSLESVGREELGDVDFFLVGPPEILAAERLPRGAPAAPRT